jgi:hypothetical protein
MSHSFELNNVIRFEHPVMKAGAGNAGRTMDFSCISEEMAKIATVRDKLVMDAFAALEACHAQLAEALVAHMGGRIRAARWMCSRRESFDGRTGYDVIAMGDLDAVWDNVIV